MSYEVEPNELNDDYVYPFQVVDTEAEEVIAGFCTRADAQIFADAMEAAS